MPGWSVDSRKPSWPRTEADRKACHGEEPEPPRDAGERGQPVHQLVLESRVAGLWCGRLSLPVVPVAAAHGRGGVVADGESCLREIAHLQIAGCRGAAHLGRDPARIDGVAEYVWPDARDGERERGYVGACSRSTLVRRSRTGWSSRYPGGTSHLRDAVR